MKNAGKIKILAAILLLQLLLPINVLAQNKYSNEAIRIYNSGVMLHRQGKYVLAKEKYQQALQLQPNFEEARKNLIITYQNLASQYFSNSEYEKSVVTYKKVLSMDSNNDSAMHSLAQVYIKSNQFDKASEIYTKLLMKNPNDEIAKNNLEYVNYQNLEKNLSNSINNLTVDYKAPEKLYKLIKLEQRVPPDATESMKTILDLIWNEPNGRIMLETLLKNKTPINITQGYVKANAKNMTRDHTLYYLGIIPIFSWETSSVSVNIPFEHIKNFNDKNLSSHTRIYNFQIFLHEFCHAFMFAKNSQNVVSIEEELGASMIGYNIATKIITGKYLDQNQTIMYSKGCLKAILSDEHRDLPVCNNFNRDIQNYGIAMPYPELYSNIFDLYKKLLFEKKVSPLPKLEGYML